LARRRRVARAAVTSSAQRTDPGRVRRENEDSLLAEPETGLFAVADGLGGHRGGATASRVALEALASFMRSSGNDPTITWPWGFEPGVPFPAIRLKNAVHWANRRILAEANLAPELTGMGSTLLALLITPGRGYFTGVGDSRLYLWRQGLLRQVSRDDSWAASMLRAGATREDVAASEMRHALTRALGTDSDLVVEVEELPLEDGDLMLLCSDGLYGPTGDAGIARALAVPDVTLEATVADLVEAANAAGGPDNITAVLVRYEQDSPAGTDTAIP
jgi:protein phosphatase